MKHSSQTSCLSSRDTEEAAPSPLETRDISVEENESQPETVEVHSSPEEPNLSEPEESETEKPVTVAVSPDVEKKDGAKVSRSEGNPKPEPVFRITSPSYQAVQYELEQFMQLKSSYSQLNSPGLDPGSPSSSFCQSPDRSPPHIPCSFSPASSPRSPLDRMESPVRLYSPLYSPSDRSDSPAPSYSPVLGW